MRWIEDGTWFSDEQQFVIDNAQSIIQILTKLSKYNSMVKVLFKNDNNINCVNDAYLTTIISIDQNNHAVYLDIGRDEVFNKRLIASQYVSFTKEDGIKIRWISTKLSMINLPDGKALKIALPKSMIGFRHHEFYRINTPIVNPELCLDVKQTTALVIDDDVKQTTVLVIDDDEFQHQIINNAFRDEPYKIISMLDAEKALTFLLRTRPDLILLDINMPNFSGIEILQRIKRYTNLSGVPIIMITKETSKNTIIECINKGAINYIVKPFTRTLLLEKVRTELSNATLNA